MLPFRSFLKIRLAIGETIYKENGREQFGREPMLKSQRAHLLSHKSSFIKPRILLQSKTWFEPIPWRNIALWSTVQFRGESIWRPTIPDMAWLFSAYALDGAEPPTAHRHHIGIQNQRHRSFVPHKHIEHITVVSKSGQLQRPSHVLLRPLQKQDMFSIQSSNQAKRNLTNTRLDGTSVQRKVVLGSTIQKHFSQSITSPTSVVGTQISYLTQYVTTNEESTASLPRKIEERESLSRSKNKSPLRLSPTEQKRIFDTNMPWKETRNITQKELQSKDTDLRRESSMPKIVKMRPPNLMVSFQTKQKKDVEIPSIVYQKQRTSQTFVPVLGKSMSFAMPSIQLDESGGSRTPNQQKIDSPEPKTKKYQTI